MLKIRPFAALRPPAPLVHEVDAPPWDTVDTTEAKAMVEDRPLSFLHIDRPEVDLRAGSDSQHARWAKARDNLRNFIERGALVHDPVPGFYVYQLTRPTEHGPHSQLGVVACVAVDDYESGKVKRHEHTLVHKETDRLNHMDALSCQASPVFLAYRDDAGVDAILASVAERIPLFDFAANEDSVRHIVWHVGDQAEVKALQAALTRLDALYIADGHHRTASAARVRGLRAARNPAHTGDESYNYFMAGLFPASQLRILEYNRVVRDLNGLSPEAFVARVAERFDVQPGGASLPAGPATFSMKLGAQWYTLAAKAGSYPAQDPIRSLDVSILQDNLLAPILGIGDPRTNPRITFVGGVRGIAELSRLVDDSSHAVAFALYPPPMSALMAVADQGDVMPPKSTWFEPKLRSGLVLHLLDGEPPQI
jgi:uncharacterized protein (DUF1015 family)